MLIIKHLSYPILVINLTNSEAHFPAELADLSLMKKVGNRMNNEGSIAQRGVESLVALFSHIHWSPQLCGVLAIKI